MVTHCLKERIAAMLFIDTVQRFFSRVPQFITSHRKGLQLAFFRERRMSVIMLAVDITAHERNKV